MFGDRAEEVTAECREVRSDAGEHLTRKLNSFLWSVDVTHISFEVARSIAMQPRLMDHSFDTGNWEMFLCRISVGFMTVSMRFYEPLFAQRQVLSSPWDVTLFAV
jgi:hypothetical protein